ncbi:MAG: glycosyltransferase family 4 protein [Sphingobacteriales bacterium]|jgi:glycosyltransferase involved in cell wall biosynthesis|nr:glycosyltransferase family 4 protein [Sphingobacteriales bacterium]MBP9141226.1 glycosyltransferase family 4 protein [Chitinophagales bacterium]MDA0199273.1 glycosyltransferase family 1 protein [Bacteroidota bacterium]MBK6890449.1 glycosyltransferase family 4 protein [Sphingobacteriales bacterium]MBK7526499.1 glycosyltransferase family 4 protein [Sphingobacteriales bacterium]
MHLAFVVRGLILGGVSRFITNVLAQIAQIPTVQLTIIGDGQNYNAPSNANHVLANKYIHKLQFDYWHSYQLLKKIQPQAAIYPSNVIPLNHFGLPHKKLNVMHDLGYFEPKINAYPFLDTLFMRTFMPISCKKANTVLAVSEFTKQDIVHRFGLNPDKIVVINEGVEPIFRIKPNPETLQIIQQKYQIHHPFWFYAGSISPRKNLLRLLQAFQSIMHQIPHHLYITGLIGWDIKPVMDLIEQLKHRVHLLGHIPETELPGFYHLAHAYLYPSLYEGFGLPILEAQAANCPVITANTTACATTAGNNSALLVNPLSTAEIAQAMLQLANNEQLRQQLILSGQANLAKYSWFTTAQTMVNAAAN